MRSFGSYVVNVSGNLRAGLEVPYLEDSFGSDAVDINLSVLDSHGHVVPILGVDDTKRLNVLSPHKSVSNGEFEFNAPVGDWAVTNIEPLLRLGVGVDILAFVNMPSTVSNQRGSTAFP